MHSKINTWYAINTLAFASPDTIPLRAKVSVCWVTEMMLSHRGATGLSTALSLSALISRGLLRLLLICASSSICMLSIILRSYFHTLPHYSDSLKTCLALWQILDCVSCMSSVVFRKEGQGQMIILMFCSQNCLFSFQLLHFEKEMWIRFHWITSISLRYNCVLPLKSGIRRRSCKQIEMNYIYISAHKYIYLWICV